MRIGTRSLRIEKPEQEVQDWFENEVYEGLERFLTEVRPSENDNYDFEINTKIDSADLRYELDEYNGGTDIYVEASGGELAVDSAMEGFDELWEESGYEE